MRACVKVSAVAIVLCCLNLASAGERLKVKPWIYDPDHLGDVASAWINKIGLPDPKDHGKDKDKGKGKKEDKGPNQGLYLQKDADTSANEAAGASIDFQGQLTELGFDIRNGSYCGAGAPRFNVYTANGAIYYFFGCQHGIHEPTPDEPGWTRVRFEATDAFPSDGTSFITDFSEIDVVGIDIVFDEGPGFAILDNIDINGTLVGNAEGTK
jgi:hypothetical protein